MDESPRSGRVKRCGFRHTATDRPELRWDSECKHKVKRHLPSSLLLVEMVSASQVRVHLLERAGAGAQSAQHQETAHCFGIDKK